jgi:hypothetical protein
MLVSPIFWQNEVDGGWDLLVNGNKSFVAKCSGSVGINTIRFCFGRAQSSLNRHSVYYRWAESCRRSAEGLELISFPRCFTESESYRKRFEPYMRIPGIDFRSAYPKVYTTEKP